MADPMSDNNWLLLDLLKEVPHTRAVVLLSADGLKKSCCGISDDDADRLSAMASALSSLASKIGQQFCRAPGVKQVAVELEEDVLLVTAAGTDSALAALASNKVDLSSLSFEMGKLCSQVPTHFGTSARHPAAPHPGP